MSDFWAGVFAGAGGILILEFAWVMWKMRDWKPTGR